MTKIEKSVVINAPISEVFNYASDYKKWHEWFVGISSVIPASITGKESCKCYEYRIRVLFFNAKVETEIYDFKANLGWKGEVTKGIPHKTQWAFQSSKKLTKFTCSLDAELKIPVIGTLIDKMILRPQWNRIIEKTLDNLASKFLHKNESASGIN